MPIAPRQKETPNFSTWDSRSCGLLLTRVGPSSSRRWPRKRRLCSVACVVDFRVLASIALLSSGCHTVATERYHRHTQPPSHVMLTVWILIVRGSLPYVDPYHTLIGHLGAGRASLSSFQTVPAQRLHKSGISRSVLFGNGVLQNHIVQLWISAAPFAPAPFVPGSVSAGPIRKPSIRRLAGPCSCDCCEVEERRASCVMRSIPRSSSNTLHRNSMAGVLI